MKPNEICHKTLTVLSAVTGLEVGSINATDSLLRNLHIDEEMDGLILALEEEFSLTIDEEDAEKFKTVIDIISWLNRVINGACPRDEFGLEPGMVPQNPQNLESKTITRGWRYRACVDEDSGETEELEFFNYLNGEWAKANPLKGTLGQSSLTHRVPFDTPIPETLIVSDPVLHPKTAALVKDLTGALGAALSAKLLAAQEKYGYGAEWDTLGDLWPVEHCQRALWEHIQKGDPLDVIAYCAFLWKKGQPTCPSPVALMSKAGIYGFRDSILHGRGLLAESLDGDQTKAVLRMVDAFFGHLYPSKIETVATDEDALISRCKEKVCAMILKHTGEVVAPEDAHWRICDFTNAALDPIEGSLDEEYEALICDPVLGEVWLCYAVSQPPRDSPETAETGGAQ